MIYLITALDAEARPFIDSLRLKRDYSLPYTLYTSDSAVLLVCGQGKANAMMGVSALLGLHRPGKTDLLLNVGICGAPECYPVGEALLIHQILDEGRRYYPDILFRHPLREAPLACVDSPQAQALETPVDMESAGVFQAASRFFKLHQILFLKIVSDHFSPQSVTKEGVVELMKRHTSTLQTLIENAGKILDHLPLFTAEERQRIERFKTFFTKSQGDALEDALTYRRLKSPGSALEIPDEPMSDSKRERSQLHERLIARLTR